jgi:hypothetical protein
LRYYGANDRLSSRVFGRGPGKAGKFIVAGKEYLTQQAATLIKFAKAVTDPQVAAGLIEKAADMKSQVDEKIDRSPRAPDVQPES